MSHTTPLLDWIEAGVSIAPYEAKVLDVRYLTYYALGVMPFRSEDLQLNYYTMSVEGF